MPLPSTQFRSPRSRMWRAGILSLTAVLSLAAALSAQAQPIYPTCVRTALPTGVVLAAGTPLTHGSFREYRCTVVAGRAYNLVLNYTATAQTPNDIGNYVGVKLYRDVAGVLTFVANSTPDGFRREVVGRTAMSNETWYVQVENLAPNSTFDTTAGVDAVLPGGGEGP